VSIVIPTLEEAHGIEETIKRIPIEELKRMGLDIEVIVVDGGSMDGTREIAEKLSAKVVLEPRRGYGRAYKTGFSHARGAIIVTLDGDGSYPSELIPALIKFLVEKGFDFITTERMAERGSMGALRRLGNTWLSLTARALFKIDLRDSQSGMWVFRRDVLKYIMPNNDGMGFSEEIKIRAFLSVKSIEVPIPYRKRRGKSKLKPFKDGISNLIYLFILWFKLRSAGR